MKSSVINFQSIPALGPPSLVKRLAGHLKATDGGLAELSAGSEVVRNWDAGGGRVIEPKQKTGEAVFHLRFRPTREGEK